MVKGHINYSGTGIFFRLFKIYIYSLYLMDHNRVRNIVSPVRKNEKGTVLKACKQVVR